MKQIKIIFLIIFLISFTTAFSKETPKEQTKEISQVEPKEIKPFVEVSEVSKYSLETLVILKDVAQNTKQSKEIMEMHESLKALVPALEKMLSDDSYKELENLNARVLSQMQSELLIYLNNLTNWNSLLESSVKSYVKYKKILEDQSNIWNETNLNADKELAPQSIKEYVTSVISKIKELKKSSTENYNLVLIDSNIITTNILKIKDILENIKKSEIVASNKIFHQNQLQFFELLPQDKFSISGFLSSSYSTILNKVEALKSYFQTHNKLVFIFYFTTLILAILIFYFNYLYRKKTLFIKEDSYTNKAFLFITMPFSTFIVLSALSLVIIFFDKPNPIVDFLILILIIPTFRILSILIYANSKKYLYTFLILFILFLVDKNAHGYELNSRVLNFIVEIGLFYFLFTILRNKVLDFIKNSFIKSFANKLVYFFLFLLVVAVGANLYGAVLLSSRIISGIFLTLSSSLIFYSIYSILTGYIVIILRRRISTATNMVEGYSQSIEYTLVKIIKVLMFLWWMVIVLKVLSLYPYILEFKDAVLALSWSISSTSISVEAIIDFLFIVVGTWALSLIVATVLKVEIFSRFTFPRGVPTAITTVLNYIIIITGTIIALSSLGVTPEQFTLVFGALGVGIGFGLRNIIANFVSGLIMVFERPVQIGDTIEINQTMGSVQSIGARSSTIKTFDGSEVIIPNADFIAKEITNWTLSDQYRRKIVNFKVDYDSDVELVLDIMKNTAVAHTDVLKDPEPIATFQGFGDNYLEFKLYFWLSENLMLAHSEVSINIYKELKKAGIKMPIPKQETLIKNLD
jgi:potassium-dependent mechanosensitive channel